MISVVMTIYNTTQYLSEAIDSVLNQTFCELELVVVDDGSSADHQARLAQIVAEKNDPRITVVMRPHEGRAKALNAGVAAANGAWISVLDADDLWHPEKLERQWAIVQDKGLDFISGLCVSFGSPNEIHAMMNGSLSITRISRVSPNVMLFDNRVSHGAILAKAELMRYDETLRSQVDYELWMRLIVQKIPLWTLESPVIFHRLHGNQSFEGRQIWRYRCNFLKLRLKYALRLRRYYFIPIILLHFGVGTVLNRRGLHWLISRLSGR